MGAVENDKLRLMAMEKTNIRDFAIFGGQPTFNKSLHVGRPNLGDRRKLFERFLFL